tara:strand:+ start:27 stop:1016 length:990 start_codon:yes stop_codon:yes gene_type:complete
MEKKYIINPFLDFILIQFPIWIPLLFLSITNVFPETYKIVLISYLIFGEIHFGSTFIFFLDKKYRELFQNEKYIFLFWPILLILFCIFFSIVFSVSAVLFLILLFNFYHVNRQSIGVLKLYGNKRNQKLNNHSIFLLYVISFSLCFIGILKFIFKSEQYFNNSSEISLLIIIFTIASLLYILINLIVSGDKDFSLLTNFSTGVLIFSPVLFCDNIIEVFAIGVGMHYMQYIAITWTVFHRKAVRKNEIGDKQFVKIGSLKKIIIYLLFYSSLMVYFSNLNIEYKNEQIGIYLIPIFFQLMHFYIDMFIWKFSSNHTRENLNPYIFNLSK